ncbi:MAG: HDOD domain-containing protein [Pseudomonadales bacterium]|nr:HDOD domain-containing protein [Pseudomonadales bacterium]
MLENLDIHYELEKYDGDLLTSRLQRANSRLTQLARVTLLQTADEKIQLITSASSLCRLDMITEQLDQEVMPIPPEAEKKFISAVKLEGLTVVPEKPGYRVLVDAGLFEAETIYLPSGMKNTYLLVSASDFKRLVAGYEITNADLPLEKLSHNPTSQETDSEQLYQAIRNYTSRKIEKNLSETLDIPPLSHTAQKVISLSANPNAEADDLIAIVELDPSLTAQVVGWAASPYYSAPGKVSSINDAIIRVLGFELVMSLAMGLAIGKTLQVPKECPRGASTFWRQSVYCAITMEKLNLLLPPGHRVESGLCYITGLLNNFGYLILAHVFKAHFVQLCRYLEVNRHLHPSLIETYLLGISRDQMSSQLLQFWNLPEEISTALRFQQDADYQGKHYVYANLCFIAQRLLAAKGIGDSPASIIPVQLYQRLGLQPASIEQVVEELFDLAVEIDVMTSVFAH